MRRWLIIPLLVAGCGQPESAPSRSVSDPAPQEPRTLHAVEPDGDGILRVLINHDMEGLSGQDDPRTFSFSKPEHYPSGREMLTGDVNAVIAGLFDGGADEVHVTDGHGSGNPDPDLDLDALDPRAVMIIRDEPFDGYSELPEPGVYDAVAVVGMHAKTGSGGFASHTFTLGMDIILNGMAITETELIGFSWGRVGVPVIFGSGDDRLAKDLETMPWIEFVTVKTATSASSAELRPVDEVRAELREGARRALENLANAKVTKLTEPVRAALRAVPPADLAVMEGVRGIDYADQTVTFEAADFQEAYDGISALINVASGAYVQLIFEVLQDQERARIIPEFRDAVEWRWFDYESGRWTPPEPPPPPTGRRYHGYR